MKVEVDADELCQMKDRIRFLERDVCRRAAENAELACERPSGDKFLKLTDERDWWRGWAVATCCTYWNPTIFSRLKLEAEKHGYEIPE